MSQPEQPSRRRLLGMGAALGAASLIPATPSLAAGQVQWRMASSFPKSLEAIYGTGERMARRVAQLTNNQFTIRVYAGNELVPALGVFDAVQAGTVELGHTASYYQVGKNKAFAFETCLPFGLTSRQQNAWYMVHGGRQLIQQFLQPYGMTSFSAGNTGAQMGGWFREPIRSLADLKGLKMRIPGIGGEILSRLGVLPQTIGGPDIYPALERGAIDATEWIGPYDDEKMGFHKVAPYYYFPGWWEAGAQLSYFANNRALARLPASWRAALEVAMAESALWMQAIYDARNPQALARLVNQHRVRLSPFPDDMLKAAQKVAFDFYREQAAANPAFARLYASWKPFRDLEGAWFNLAETSVENFMYRHPVR